MACECLPSANIVCVTNQNINVTQPACQRLPDDTLQPNPYFNIESNFSYFTYTVIGSCALAFTDVYIPVCDTLTMDLLTVNESLASCGRFNPVSYTFENPVGVIPPEGFQYIRIQSEDRFDAGACVTYRLQLMGDYENGGIGILVLTTPNGDLAFDGGYTVPTCPQVPRVTITQTVERFIMDNTATLMYTTNIANTGNVDLTEIAFSNPITYDSGNVTLGTITTVPPDLIITSGNDLITFSTTIDTLNIGEMITFTYTIPIAGFAGPGTYTFSSMATATLPTSDDLTILTLGESVTNATTNITIEVVAVAGSACCIVDGNTITFQMNIVNQPNSPSTFIDVGATLQLISPLTIRFTSLSSCGAVFPDGSPVPLNQDITSGDLIDIGCINQSLPIGTSLQLQVIFDIISINTSMLPPFPPLVLTLVDINLTATDAQIFLPVTGLPATATANVNTTLNCSLQCT